MQQQMNLGELMKWWRAEAGPGSLSKDKDKNRKKYCLVPLVAETLATQTVSYGHLVNGKVTACANWNIGRTVAEWGCKEALTWRLCDIQMRLFIERHTGQSTLKLLGQDDILAKGGTWGLFPLSTIETHPPTPDYICTNSSSTSYPLSINVHFLDSLSSSKEENFIIGRE